MKPHLRLSLLAERNKAFSDEEEADVALAVAELGLRLPRAVIDTKDYHKLRR